MKKVRNVETILECNMAFSSGVIEGLKRAQELVVEHDPAKKLEDTNPHYWGKTLRSALEKEIRLVTGFIPTTFQDIRMKEPSSSIIHEFVPAPDYVGGCRCGRTEEDKIHVVRT